MGYVHKDTKTDEPLREELQNYFQVINGTALYYENYVKILQQKVEQLEKENERLKEWKEDLLSENIELESIRKEAIEYILTCNDKEKLNSMFLDESYISNYGAKDLLNILNKGNEE